jgi:hypothetical protein
LWLYGTGELLGSEWFETLRVSSPLETSSAVDP